MTIVARALHEFAHVAVRNLNNRNTPTAVAQTAADTTTSSPTASATQSPQPASQSPLLFFVALGFGVVFTNLWIIVGVKYCFRYNARNRALARGEGVDPIDLQNMPRPRRRREKKLMSMEEVNERFPLIKYKSWIASRESQGLPAAGGVAASRAASIRDAEGIVAPVTTTKNADSRPATAISLPDATKERSSIDLREGNEQVRRSMDGTDKAPTVTADQTHLPALKEVNTTATADTKDAESDDEDEHIHTALGPDILDHPGDSCAICIDTLEADEDVRGLTCGHAFHAGCLDPWLTSRRACCPLCKADYYVPKPRPEGEAAAAGEHSTRRSRRAAANNMPQPPLNVWTGIRGSHRMILPGRFLSGSQPAQDNSSAPAGRRARREASTAAAAQQSTDGSAPEVSDATRSRFFRMPRFALPSRRAAAAAPTAQTTPAQLEAGVRT